MPRLREEVAFAAPRAEPTFRTPALCFCVSSGLDDGFVVVAVAILVTPVGIFASRIDLFGDSFPRKSAGHAPHHRADSRADWSAD
jgi:hypothetical protein